MCPTRFAASRCMKLTLTHKRTTTILLTLIVLLTGALAITYEPPPAAAHVTSRTACQAQALAAAQAVPPATVVEFRIHFKRCMTAAVKHSAMHRLALVTRRCLAVRGSDMSRSTCRALATAAIERGKPAWAYNSALHELLRRESTWSPNAINDASHACGLFQRLVKRPHPQGGRGCPWPISGAGTRHERVHHPAVDQARNGLKYIAERLGYGTPERALRFHDTHGWY